MTAFVLIVFVLVYLGLFLGGLPLLKLDRTGVALLGAIALVASGAVPESTLWEAVHVPTLALLFAFMVISAQLRLGGFYTWVVERLHAAALPPPLLLAALIVSVALLAAVFSNDIVCLAMAPMLIEVCRARRLDPLPFLLALACAANIGSAATLIGNPQNILIGEMLRLSFADYLITAALPVALGLLATWVVLIGVTRGRWERRDWPAPPPRGTRAEDGPAALDRWQTAKGLSVAGVLLLAFLWVPWPRDLLALAGAGLLLTSRQLHSHRILGLVDWPLLVLFVGLFIVNHALQETGVPTQAVAMLAEIGLDLREPLSLLLASVTLSNLVSNVPAVMLLLPSATAPLAGPLLALSSTLAGNLLIIGSIANIIVAQAAARHGIPIDWHTHARVGMPVTLLSLVLMVIALWPLQ